MSAVEPGNSERAHLNETPSGLSDSRSYPSLHVRFGPYEVNGERCELRKGTLKLKLPHQSFQILAMLLEKPGQVVSRESLRRELWPDDVYVNFEGSLNSAVQRLRSALQDTSREPRYIETLPREGYRFIASVERPTPVCDEEAKSATTVDSSELPSVSKESVELPSIVSVPSRNWRYWAPAMVLLLIVLVVSYAWYRYNRQNQHAAEAQAQPPLVVPPSLPHRSVAIMGFANVSGDARNGWLSTAFSEMLATELAAGDQLRTVAAEHVARAKLELSLPNEDSYASDTLTRIHKDLGCDYVVTGSYVPTGQATNGQLRLDARVQDAITGDTVASVAVIGSRADLSDLASRAGGQLRAKLGVAALTSTESEEVKLALPSDAEAARLYSDGLARLRLYDNVAAKDLFERVIGLQPEYSPAYSALAVAWSSLGYDAKATEAARRAMDLAHNLPQQTRLQTEARYHEMSGEWTQAIEMYSRLLRSYPDNLDYGLNLARAQHAMGSNVEAAATIVALRKFPSPERDDPRIDLFESGIAGELADYQRERTLAESAAKKAETTGARILLARAKLMEGYASSSLGDFRIAMDNFAEAQRMFAESGNLADSAAAVMNRGIILAEQGDLAGAKRSYEQALNVFREKGEQASLASALVNIAEIYRIEGDLPKAEHLTRETLAIFDKLNRKRHQDLATGNLAGLLVRQGKFREAKELLEPLVEHLRSTADKSLLAHALETFGSIVEIQGDMPTALRMYQESAVLFKDSGAKTEYAEAERSVGKAFSREGDFVSAKRALSEARSVDHDIGAKSDIDLGQVELAEVSLAQGEPVDMAALGSAVDELHHQKMTDDEIEAEVVLARAILQQGKNPEAASALTKAAALSAKSYDPTVRFDVALATAHLRTAQHHFDEARRTARPALQRAVAMGCVRCQLEARLELGEIEVQAGNAERGRAQLRQLANEAGGRGFRLLAEHAAADSAGPAESGNFPGRTARRNPVP